MAETRPARGAASFVAAGILASRVVGFVRTRLMAQYLGAGVAADAFNAAFKIPNLLQNLFGEGALSASFIPVYARLLSAGDEREASRVAGAVAAWLSLTVAVLVALGVTCAPYLIPVLAPGFEGERRELTIAFTRVLFPGAGLFVLSAWCLGIQNSHRRFLLSYAAPVLWNLVMIGALLIFRGSGPADLALVLAWASVVGAAVQFVVQLPVSLRLAHGVRPHFDLASENIRSVLRNFGPAFVSRGAVQLSGYIDQLLASLLPIGMVANMAYAQQLYTLPVSLFGMSVSAAELTEMSRVTGESAEATATLRARMNASLRQMSYFVVPSAAAFLALGDVIASLLLEVGAFRHQDTVYVWQILGGSAIGLLASTMSRLYSSTYYALRDTRTPLMFALVRVALVTALGWLFAFPLPRILGLDPHWGGAGLTASAGIAGWIEFALLRGRLRGRIGETGVPAAYLAQVWLAAGVSAAGGWGVKLALAGAHRWVAGPAVILTYCAIYAVSTLALGLPEAKAVLARLRRVVRR